MNEMQTSLLKLSCKGRGEQKLESERSQESEVFRGFQIVVTKKPTKEVKLLEWKMI